MGYTVLEIEREVEGEATPWLAKTAKRNAMGPAFWNELPPAMAARIARTSPPAVQGTWRVRRSCEGNRVKDRLACVATRNAACVESDDVREAMAAFFEKREPRFHGR